MGDDEDRANDHEAIGDESETITWNRWFELRAADGYGIWRRGAELDAEPIVIGLVTPPYGLLLFLMVKIGNVSLTELVREVLPFLWVMIGALVLITYVPEIVLFLPKLFGYKGMT